MPVSLIDSDADDIFPTNLTVQTPLSFAELLNVAEIISTEGESDEPLFRLTITRFTELNSTSIGACNSHILCAFPYDLPGPFVRLTRTVSVDGSGLLMFLKLLSQLYQGLGPLDPPPFYEPEAIKFAESLMAPSPIFHRYNPSALPPWELPERKAMEFIAFRFTAVQLAEIHDSVTKGMEHLRISRVDTVVGLLARCLSELEPESKPISTVSYVVNVCAFIPLPSNSTYFATAPRNGYISGQCSAQRDHLAFRGSASLERR